VTGRSSRGQVPRDHLLAAPDLHRGTCSLRGRSGLRLLGASACGLRVLGVCHLAPRSWPN